MRVAIIGCGPKGLFALERLLSHARALDGCRLEVDVFEPHPAPGAGPWYDPAQPGYLRMNIAAEQVDMWWPGTRAVPAPLCESLTAWRARVGVPDPGRYPARALVGRYLASGLEALLAHAPPSATVRVRRLHVRALEPGASGWYAVHDGDEEGPFDEVLVATGHVPGPAYPVEPDRLPAGASVAVRGFALTFIDVALALGETRPDLTILPFSRSGRPMHPKPTRELTASIAGLGGIAERGAAELRGLTAPLDLARDVLPVVARVADLSLEAAGVAVTEPAGEWLALARTGRPPRSAETAAAELARALAVGRGEAPPDVTWSLGHAWRALYPALVAQLGDDGLATPDWPAFLRLAGALERIAFGPSPENAARLLELVGSGRVDLSHVAGGRVVADGSGRRICSAAGERPIDAVLDAVLPPPGVARGSGSLADRLVAAGHARIAEHRRGVEVDPDGSCRARDGSRTPGLAMIGRPTEDSVIGNDTLVRTLHPLADRWAARVVARCRAGVGEPAAAVR